MKKLARRILLLCLVILNLPSLVEGKSNKKVAWLLENNFIHGKSKESLELDLDSSLTRAEATKLIIEIINADKNDLKDQNESEINFTDLPESHWAYSYIKQAGNKLIKGYPDGTFKPDQKMSQEEFLTILVRILGGNIDESTAKWPEDYIDKAIEFKLIDSYIKDQSLNFNRKAAFEIIYNSLDYKGIIDKIDRENNIKTSKANDIDDNFFDILTMLNFNNLEEKENDKYHKDNSNQNNNDNSNQIDNDNNKDEPNISERNNIYLNGIIIKQGSQLTEADILENMIVSPGGQEVIKSVEPLTKINTITTGQIYSDILITFTDDSQKIGRVLVNIRNEAMLYSDYLGRNGIILPANMDVKTGEDIKEHLSTEGFDIELEKAVFQSEDFNTGPVGTATPTHISFTIKGEDKTNYGRPVVVYSEKKIEH